MAIDIYKPDFVAAGKFLVLLASPFVFVAILFWGAIGYLYVSTKLSPPAHSASMSIPELNATVKLEFYMVWDETEESGRFLTISTRGGSVRSEITGFDWSHNARTSLYQTPQHDLAVLGPTEDDYLAHLQTLQLKPLSPITSSQGWIYIGAFDFGGPGHTLQFFPASQQPECIPMRMEEDKSWLKMSRGESRKRDCYSR